MKRVTKIVLAIVGMSLQPDLFAQNLDTATHPDYFKISAQYRVRPEFRQGYRTLSTDTSSGAFFVGQRARIILDYKKGGLSFYTSIQDSRTWGDEEQRKDIGGLQVNELWVDMPLYDKLTIKLGRQEFAYDDHRILGNLDWANLTISHDALLIKYTNPQKGIQWHAAGAFNQVGEPFFGTNYNLKNYKFLGFTWAKVDLSKIHSSVSGIVALNGLKSTDTLHTSDKSTYTAGAIFNYQHKGWKSNLGAYYQGGKSENNLTVSAYMVNAYAQYKYKKMIVGLGGDLLSGNTKNTPANETNCFTTLYATNHKFYGYMDYFLAIPGDTKQGGLMDLYLRVGVAPAKNMQFTLDAHSFSLASSNNLVTGNSSRDLGTEFDLLFDYQISSVIQLQAGYCMLMATDNMEKLKGGDAQSYNGWSYVMLKVSPTLFLHEFTK